MCDLLLCTKKGKYRNETGKHKIHDVYTVVQLQGQGEDPELYVIRSVPLDEKGEGGIVVDTWTNFKSHIMKIYSDVLYRHLYCERDATFEKNL